MTGSLEAMNTPGFFIFTGMFAALIFLRHGFSFQTGIAVLAMALFAAIPWYFGTRDRSIRPSRFERFLANVWVWFRRSVGIGAGALFLWTAWSVVGTNILGGSLLAVAGVFFVYVGVVGQGNDRLAWRDDIALHRDNKRRYKWWI